MGENMVFSKDKEFYKGVISVAIPIAIQNVITFGVSMMDIVMLGALGDVAVASANLANQLQFLLMLLCMGVAGGANILIAQYWGKGDHESINSVLAIMYKIGMGVSILCSFVAILFPTQFLSLYTNDPQVVEGGASYLRIMTISYMFFGFTNLTLSMLRSVRTVKIAMVVYTASFFVNTTLNYVLIFGKLGMPAMGIEGAAIATLISRIVESVIVLVFMVKIEDKLKIRLKNLKGIDKFMLSNYARVGFPVIINEVTWGIGFSALSMIVGKMGTEMVTASSIVSTVEQLVAVFMFGFASAAAVSIGNAIGEGKDQESIFVMVRTFELIGLVIGILAAVIMFFSRPIIIGVFNVSDLAKEYANGILVVCCFVQVFRSMNNVRMLGLLRGGGDSKFVMMLDIVFLWGLCIPLGILTGLILKLPIPLVYIMLRIDEPFKFIVSTIRIRGNKWIKNVTM